MKFLLWLMLLTAFLNVGQAAQLPRDIIVETHLEQTAFFVGEPIRYRVLVLHNPSIEFILDRLQKQNLEMDPFQIRDLRVSASRQETHRLLTINMTLVSYEIQQERWEIPAFNLYYIDREGPVDALGESTVEAWQVASVPIGFRSALPDETIRIRDFIGFEELSGSFWLTLLVGLAGMAAVGVPAGRQLLRYLHGETEEVELERSEIRSRGAQALMNLNWNGGQDADSINSLYQQLGAALRDYVSSLTGKRGRAFTAAELERILREAGEGAEEAAEISSLVAFSDRVLYSPAGHERGQAARQDIRSRALRLFQS